MTLETRLGSLITAVGADIKALNTEMPNEIFPFFMSGLLTTKVGGLRVYMDYPCTVDVVRIGVGTAPTGATVMVDVNRNGTTIYGTQALRPAIAISAFTAVGGTESNGVFAAGDYLTVDVDQVGSTIAGQDLSVIVRVIRN